MLGTKKRDPSGARTSVYVRPISSTVPAAPETSTRSPRRRGWVNATRMPAMKFERVVWAANPITRAMTAEEARMAPVTACTWGMTRRAERTPTVMIVATAPRRRTR
jgi:hypothetical protein